MLTDDQCRTIIDHAWRSAPHGPLAEVVVDHAQQAGVPRWTTGDAPAIAVHLHPDDANDLWRWASAQPPSGRESRLANTFGGYGLWPGSQAAHEHGCICPILDNGHGNVEAARDRGGWWQRCDCPIHGPRPAPIPEQHGKGAP